MNISYSFGIVDFFHYGHLRVFQEAKKNADLHYFGLVSDEAAVDWIGRTISNYNERKAVLKSIRYIDHVILQKTLDPLDNIKMLHNKYPKAKITVYHGSDWKIFPAQSYIASIGGETVLVEYYSKLSPAKILQKLSSKDILKNDIRNLISTKADTLAALRTKLKTAEIEDMYILSSSDFKKNPVKCSEEIRDMFSDGSIVIRSSSSNEDCFEKSNAGHYESFLNVSADDIHKIMDAVHQVIKSYENDGINGDEQILIQKQTENVTVSGVIFTRDIKLNRPYYVINYSDDGATDYVTSGQGGKTVFITHNFSSEIDLGEWHGLITAIKEIEELLPGMVLDIEFALTAENKVVIFQARPLAANYKFVEPQNDNEFFDIKEQIKKQYRKCINVYSDKIMMFSDMAFWNPSEIIGDNPRCLSYSIYREIITKDAWNRGLVPMGYNEVPKDLMYKIGNKPYISLEYSFMSLIPSNLGRELSVRLVEYYKSKLSKDMTAHDKIEFEIAMTCYDFETDIRLEALYSEGFTEKEVQLIKSSLHSMTLKAIKDYQYVLSNDLNDIEILENKRKDIEQRIDNSSILDQLYYIKGLVENLTTYGTPQFSRQARYAFIAKSICRTLASCHYVDESDVNRFMSTINTVTSEFNHDMERFSQGTISKAELNKKYGHLRAGTYDITSLPYSQIDFASDNGKRITVKKEEHFVFSESIINKALNELNFDLPADNFVAFIKESFEQREYFKYEFTKSVSLLLEIIASIGVKLGYGREDLSYLDLSDVFAAEYYYNEEDLREFWSAIIRQRKNDHDTNSRIVLPEVLQSPDDIDVVKINEARPNFITDKVANGEIALLEESMDQDINDKIVIISKADPGFDWIFAKNIKGLITKYGGVASHMAIRCAEFEIPAAIGCGEKIFDSVSNSKELILDCKNRRIEVI